MSAPKVRSDYDELHKIAQAFLAEAEAIGKTTRAIKEQMQALQGGDWIGAGAQKYFQEMNGQVLPTLGRLQNALDEAAQATEHISATMHQAEQEASRCFQVGLDVFERVRGDAGAELKHAIQEGVRDMSTMEGMISNMMKTFYDAQMSVINNMK